MRVTADYGVVGVPSSVTEVWTADTLEIRRNGDLEQSLPNPYGFIPYIIFPNLRVPKEPWGQSDLVDLVGINRDLNSRMSILSHILEVSGNPIAVLENVTDSTGIKVGPGRLWELPKDARAYLLDLLSGGGVQLHIEYINLLYRAMHDLAEMPRTAFGDGEGTARSGVALEMELQPILQKVARKRAIWTVALRERARMILSLYALHGDEAARAVTSHGRWLHNPRWYGLPSCRPTVQSLCSRRRRWLRPRSTPAGGPWICWAKATLTLNGRRCLRKRHSKGNSMSNRTELRARLRLELGDTGSPSLWSDTFLDDLLVEAGEWYSRLWPRHATGYRDVASGERIFAVPDGALGISGVECPPGLPLPQEASPVIGASLQTGVRQTWSLWGDEILLGRAASGDEVGSSSLVIRHLLPWDRLDPVEAWNGPKVTSAC